jgi:osmotically-inducible protein OsmY
MKKVLILVAALFLVNGCVGSSNNSISESAPVKYVADSVLTAKVKTALIGQQGLKGFTIHVNSHRGIVQLSGFVNTDMQKELAGQIARNVDGVAELVNNLIVQP